MLTLVLKDLHQQRKTLLTQTGVALIIVALLGTKPATAAGLYAWVTLFTFTYVSRLTHDDDRNKTLVFLRALPVSPAHIVLSKYLSTLIVAVGAIPGLARFGAIRFSEAGDQVPGQRTVDLT